MISVNNVTSIVIEIASVTAKEIIEKKKKKKNNENVIEIEIETVMIAVTTLRPKLLHTADGINQKLPSHHRKMTDVTAIDMKPGISVLALRSLLKRKGETNTRKGTRKDTKSGVTPVKGIEVRVHAKVRLDKKDKGRI